jgi:molybdenum cofactor cytidylyltransferase
MEVVGILLAAGRGTRFDASARRLKLLEPRTGPAASAEPIAAAAARTLRTAVASVVAVVRDESSPQQRRLEELLAAAGCRVVRCRLPPGAAEGTGASIACAVGASAGAAGWIVALADMPAIAPATVAAVHAAIAGGAASAAPYYGGRRGHPVGFGAACRADLMQLQGDTGARSLLEQYPPLRITVDDPGILLDIDHARDL